MDVVTCWGLPQLELFETLGRSNPKTCMAPDIVVKNGMSSKRGCLSPNSTAAVLIPEVPIRASLFDVFSQGGVSFLAHFF